MVLQGLVPEDLSFQLGQQVWDAADFRSRRGRQVMGRRHHRRRKCGRDLEGSHVSLGPEAIRDGEREGLVHRRRADRRARQPADAQEHLAEIFDPLATGLAAAQVVAGPFEILPIEPIVEHGTR